MIKKVKHILHSVAWSGDQIRAEDCQAKTDPCRLGNFAWQIPYQFLINAPSTMTIFDKWLIIKKVTFLNAAFWRSQHSMAPIKNASCLRSQGSQMILEDAVRDEPRGWRNMDFGYTVTLQIKGPLAYPPPKKKGNFRLPMSKNILN